MKLDALTGLTVLPGSVVAENGIEFGLTRDGSAFDLVVLEPSDGKVLRTFAGDVTRVGDEVLLRGPRDARNAAALREALPWLQPRAVGQRASFGFGDRLGLATPGHVRALRRSSGHTAPVFAQQSIREMERTARSPQDVIDDAMWGVFAEGWRDGFAADADHVKTLADLDRCVDAGFTFFTVDPGDLVDDSVDGLTGPQLDERFDGLPWAALETDPSDVMRRYRDVTVDLGSYGIRLSAEDVARAAVKYGRAIGQAADMCRHLSARSEDFELEIAVDETATPTTPEQHAFIALELRRLGVRWTSLAPRLVGRLEKAIDYVGEVAEFRRDIVAQADIARGLGPYKLSLHSGSDKFRIYAAFAEATDGVMHVKTSGTSYLEGLRMVSRQDPGVFRTVYGKALEQVGADRHSYPLQGTLTDAPSPDTLSDADLPAVLDQPAARQVLHVTYGSVLRDETGLGGGVRDILTGNVEEYWSRLESHLGEHLSALSADHVMEER